MPANPLIFRDAEKARDAILDSQKQQIENLYKEWSKEVGELANYYSHKEAPSYVVAERQMKELMAQMNATSQEIAAEIYNGTKKNIYVVADAVVKQNAKWLSSLGFESGTLDMAFNYVPDEVVRNLITGQIYDSGWSLSRRIWSDNEDTMRQAYQIVAGGMAQNKPIYQIAKDLEQYVQPGAKKLWNLVAPDGKKIYPKQVDYCSQRLARTLVQHGYQQSFVATTQKNPFISDYIWMSNGSRVCDLCAERNGKHFKKDELPLDHPNGMCTMVPNVSKTLTDDLANWFNSPDGTYPEVDEFASNFGYNASRTAKAVKPKDSVKNKAVVQNLSDEAKDVVKRYTTGGYKSINEQADSYLSGTPREKAFSKSGSTLFDAVNSSTEEFDTLYRIETSSGFVVKGGKVISSPLKEGDQITWGLRSTSKSDKFIGKAAAGKDKNLQFVGEDDFNTKVVYRLRDETGLDVSKISPYKSQQEVIVSGNFEVVTTGTVTDVGGERVILVDIKRKR